MDFAKYKNPIEYTPATRQAWSRVEGELNQQFRDDALKEVGLFDHPKAGAIYAKAWEYGHAYGFYEVFNYLSDLAPLFKD
jgi:hypothetical protein